MKIHKYISLKMQVKDVAVDIKSSHRYDQLHFLNNYSFFQLLFYFPHTINVRKSTVACY